MLFFLTVEVFSAWSSVSDCLGWIIGEWRALGPACILNRSEQHLFCFYSRWFKNYVKPHRHSEQLVGFKLLFMAKTKTDCLHSYIPGHRKFPSVKHGKALERCQATPCSLFSNIVDDTDFPPTVTCHIQISTRII